MTGGLIVTAYCFWISKITISDRCLSGPGC